MEFPDPRWECPDPWWEFPPWMMADLAAMGVVKDFQLSLEDRAEEKEETAEKAEEEKGGWHHKTGKA